MDEDEDLLGRRLKLIKSYDGNIKSAHVFYGDSVSIHPLKNLRLIKSAFDNLLNSETMFFSEYADQSFFNPGAVR